MIPSSGCPPWPPDHPRTLPRTGTPTPPRGARPCSCVKYPSLGIAIAAGWVQSRGRGGALGCASSAPDCAAASWLPAMPLAAVCALPAVGAANVAAAVTTVADPKNPRRVVAIGSCDIGTLSLHEQ